MRTEIKMELYKKEFFEILNIVTENAGTVTWNEKKKWEETEVRYFLIKEDKEMREISKNLYKQSAYRRVLSEFFIKSNGICDARELLIDIANLQKELLKKEGEIRHVQSACSHIPGPKQGELNYRCCLECGYIYVHTE